MQTQCFYAAEVMIRGHNNAKKGTLLDPGIVPSAKPAMFRQNSIDDYDSERLAAGVNTSYHLCTSLA